MKARSVFVIATAAVVSATCLALGMWQLKRLGERREFNAVLAERFAAVPVQLAQLPADTATARYRRVLIAGIYDYSKEFVISSRIRQGSPGVNIITPVRTSGSDTAVLVNRGWVYAPDGMTVDLTKWREQDSVAAEGYVETYPAPGKGNPASPTRPNTYRWLDRSLIARHVSYPLAQYHVLLAADSIPPPRDVPQNIPPRLPVPTLDEGPHVGYAFQWFSFAAVSIIGTYLFLRRK